MQYLIIALILPAVYLTYLTFRWLSVREKNKNKRVHFTKKAIYLLLLSIIAIYLSSRFALSGIQDKTGGSFWLNTIIYMLAVAIIAGYFYIVVKATNSKKNITKFLVLLLSISLYAPVVWWGYQIFSVGVYDGKLGVTKPLAIKLADEYIGTRINHSFKHAKRHSGYWLLTETLYTLDSKSEIDVDYKVAMDGGIVSNAHSDQKIPIEIVRDNSSEGVEMMLFVDESTDPNNPQPKALEYSVTAANGVTNLSMISGSSLKYYLQIRDCTFSCQYYFYELTSPIKENYKIELDNSQTGVAKI